MFQLKVTPVSSTNILAFSISYMAIDKNVFTNMHLVHYPLVNIVLLYNYFINTAIINKQEFTVKTIHNKSIEH